MAVAHHAPHRGLQGQIAQAPLTQIKIAFATRANATELQAKADKVSALLSREVGMPVADTIADETAAVEAMRTNRVQVTFLIGLELDGHELGARNSHAQKIT